MDIEIIKTGLMMINMLGTLAIGVWLYLEKRSDRTNQRIDDVEGVLDEHGTTLATLRANAASAPTHGDLGDLHDRVTEVAKGVSALTGEFVTVRNVLQLIHEHLLRGGRP